MLLLLQLTETYSPREILLYSADTASHEIIRPATSHKHWFSRFRLPATPETSEFHRLVARIARPLYFQTPTYTCH